MNIQRRLALSILLVLSILCQSTRAQNQTPSADDARIARLIGLAKVWGTAKYFHPYLAYRDIDWDKALIETIPKVNAAKTPQDYQAALNQMLAVLNDKSTRADIEAETKTPSPAPATTAKLVRTENGVLVIEAVHIAQAVAKDISTLSGFAASINQSLPPARGVIIDARRRSKVTELEAYHLDNFLRQTLTTMLDSNLVLGATRYRMHNGYATQTGGGANFYYSAFINSAPKTIAGRAKTKTPPIVFIINQHSPALTEIMSGLQSAGRAQIVLEGEQAPGETFTIELPDGVKVRMRTAELVNADGSVDLQPDVTVANGATEEAMRAVRENKTGPTPMRSGAAIRTFHTVEEDKSYPDSALI